MLLSCCPFKKKKGDETHIMARQKTHNKKKTISALFHGSGHIIIIPKPELRVFWGNTPTKSSFGVTSAEVAIICPDGLRGLHSMD